MEVREPSCHDRLAAFSRRRRAGLRSQLEAVDRRVMELSSLLSRLVARGEGSLDELESDSFDPNRHAARFRAAMSYAVAVRDLAAAPVVTEDGKLNDDTDCLLFKYREMM